MGHSRIFALTTPAALVGLAAILAALFVQWHSAESAGPTTAALRNRPVAGADLQRPQVPEGASAIEPARTGEPRPEPLPTNAREAAFSTRRGTTDVSVRADEPSRARGFDASEGTKLDPLLNTTYDLQSTKEVPVLDPSERRSESRGGIPRDPFPSASVIKHSSASSNPPAGATADSGPRSQAKPRSVRASPAPAAR